MREIKFRAWDKWKNQMVMPNDGDFIGWHGPSNWKECYEVMQFTGLHDKNGKEVWEGDIVHVERNDSFPSYNQAIIVYEENRGMFMLLYTKPTNPKGFLSQVAITSEDRTRMFEQCTGWEIEVIGNEYEHPELTEEGK
jgi:uncharacterized phage protein (TIGR01671 family)